MTGPLRADGPPGDGRTGPGLRDLAFLLFRRRWVVLSCTSIVLAAGMITMAFTTPIYRATATLQIERQGPDILTFKDVVGVDPSYASYQDFYQTQYKILHSRAVIQRAIERLDLLNRPEFLSRRQPPLRRALAAARRVVSGAPLEGDPADRAMSFVEQNLLIEPVRNSQLVRISFDDQDPAFARDLANGIADAYVHFNYELRHGTTRVAKEFLTKEVARVQAEIDTLERKLQEDSQQREILTLDDDAGDISQQALAALNARSIDARGRLAQAQARHEALQALPQLAIPEVNQRPLIDSLKRECAGIERRVSEMAERFKSDWPALAELREAYDSCSNRLEMEAASIATQIRRVAETEFLEARAEVTNLQRELDRQREEVRRVWRDTIDVAGLRASIDTKRRVLDDLVARQSETVTSDRLRDTGGASNIRIVDAAELPEQPIRPRKVTTACLALVLGLCMGVGVVIVMDHVDNTIKSEKDIHRAADVTLLGHIPLLPPALSVVAAAETNQSTAVHVDLACHHDSRSAYAEACRNLRTTLLLAAPDQPPRSLVVTSCEPGEGKSTIVSNLAIVLAQLGRRCLVMDADLRRPRLHDSFETDNAVGLSSYLTGNAERDELIQPTLLHGLSIIPSGPIPPNPSELLNSARFGALVAWLLDEAGFDHVLIDSPPVLQVTDGVILATQADATVVVARHARTSRDALAQGVARLQQARARIAGAVLNAVARTPGYYRKYQYPSPGAAQPQPVGLRGRASRRRVGGT